MLRMLGIVGLVVIGCMRDLIKRRICQSDLTQPAQPFRESHKMISRLACGIYLNKRSVFVFNFIFNLKYQKESPLIKSLLAYIVNHERVDPVRNAS